MEYYVYRNGQQIGPLTKEALEGLHITADTPVWYEGLADWMPAGQAPQTAYLFDGSTPPPFGGQQSGGQVPPQGFARAMYDQAQSQQQPRCPENYLAWAIVVTLLCCLPFGIVAIVKAASVNDKFSRGDFAGAEEASRSARTWCIVSAAVGVLGGIIYGIYTAAFALGQLAIM